jgi:putative peptidoglycan lipid II flippase
MFSIRSILKVGTLTLASRVLGFARDMLLAALIGTGPIADAWFVAMRLPNLFRRLFAEGAFNAAFVPMFAGRLEAGGAPAARGFAERVLAIMLAFLLILTVLAELAMPWLIMLFAPGFIDDPGKFGMTVLFTAITFPYLLFMCLSALLGGILNSLHHFGHAAAAPILLNLVLVLGLAFVAPQVEQPGLVLVWGVALAGLLQFLWLFLAARAAGMSLRLPRPRIDGEIRQMVKLMVPGLIGGGVTQISILIATILASLQDQAVSYLSYADRLYQLPLALIGAAIGVVLLPVLARAIRAGREGEAMAAFNRSIEFALLLTLPATVGLIAAGEPIIRVLYERGAFTAEATQNTAYALMAISLGLPAFVLNKALQPGFYAREDTLTPFKFSIATVIADIAICLALFPFIGFVGIALGTGLAAWINTVLLYRKLRALRYLAPDDRLKRNLPRLLLANLVMAGVLIGGQVPLSAWLVGSQIERAASLALLIGVAALVYFAIVFATGAYTLADFKRHALRR